MPAVERLKQFVVYQPTVLKWLYKLCPWCSLTGCTLYKYMHFCFANCVVCFYRDSTSFRNSSGSICRVRSLSIEVAGWNNAPDRDCGDQFHYWKILTHSPLWCYRIFARITRPPPFRRRIKKNICPHIVHIKGWTKAATQTTLYTFVNAKEFT